MLAISGTQCSAQGFDHADITVFESPGGKLTTGLVFWATASAQNGTIEESRVFSGQFDDNYVVNNPGWGVPPGLLPGATPLEQDFLPMTLDVNGSPLTSNLLYWDGDGAVDFGQAPADHAFWFVGSNGFAIVDGSDEMVPGQLIQITANSGYVHQHHDFFLDGTGDGTGATAPDDGIYLIAMHLRMPGLESSDPFYMVWSTPGVDLLPAVDAAIAWVEPLVDVLVPVPLDGDFNGDGMVDVVDYTVWRDGFSAGDFDIDDYTLWKTNFGATSDAGAIASAPLSTLGSVPEPAAATLLALLGLAGCGLPRRWGLR